MAYYDAFERKTIVTEIRAQLRDQPATQTRNRKPLRANPLAPWELRIGKYRAFYEVNLEIHYVRILAVGHKEHGQLWIRGQEVEL